MTRGKEGSGMTEERNRRMTGTERDEIMRLAVVDTILSDTREKLKARAGMVVRGRARLGLAAWAVDSLLEDLMGTIPANQLLSLRNNLRMNAFTIGAKRPGGGRAGNEYGVWISFNELNALLAGCHDHCLMCAIEDAGLQRACPLRKAMDAIVNDVEERTDGKCPYYGVV